MADPFKNTRAYYDVTVPSSGDGFSIAALKNALQGLAFMDMIPLQPRAHSPADNKIMVRGRDASNFYNPGYYNDANSRIPFASGDTPAFSAPVSNPRIDIVYVTASGDLKIQQGTEATNPTLPSLAPSGDTRFPVCAVYNKPGQTRIVNFETKDSSTGDGYIYQDLRPWLTQPKTGGATFSAVTPVTPTGDAQAGPGTASTAARSDHVHGGVHAVRVVGQSNIQGDLEIAGAGGVLTQAGNRITVNGGVVDFQYQIVTATSTGSTAIPDDNTPPQNNEGDQYLTVTLTPKAIGNLIYIKATGFFDASSAIHFTMALFRDSIVTALAATHGRNEAGGIARQITLDWYMIAGTTSPITFNIRVGSADGTAIRINGESGSALYGGVAASSIFAMEIAK